MNPKQNIIDEKSINDINYQLLKKQFPYAVSIDEDGKYIIDPKKLQMSLEPSKAEIKEDGYGLNWVGKKEAYHKAFSKNYKVLKPLVDESKNWDTTGNILIKGDNLDALKILRHNYFESIKMIYIDPPYNTKNDGFVYKDNFTSNTKETLSKLGYDSDYVDYIQNIQGAKTHSGWLSFIYPRLLLARDLLKDDGVIFISIDDNEIAQLKLLCDEVFGEENFISIFKWNKTSTPPSLSKKFRQKYEYILCYEKQYSDDEFNGGITAGGDMPLLNEGNKTGELRFDKNVVKFNFDGKFKKGIYDRVELLNDIEIKNGKSNKDIHLKSKFKWTQSNLEKEIINKTKFVIKTPQKFAIRYIKCGDRVKKPADVISKTECDVGTNEEANKELEALFGIKSIFDYPKPVSLCRYLIAMKTSNDDIVLDFFAGSGSTAHGVMDINAKDGGNRKFISVQLAEDIPLNSEAKKAGYNTIFDITKDRIKKAGDKISKGDIGFRTFEIVEDIKQYIYQKSLEDVTQNDLLAFTKNSIETSEDILYNLLVAEKLPLCSKVTTLIKDKLYLVLNSVFVLGDISMDKLVEKLNSYKELEYITIYSPNINDDKFTLELESVAGSMGIKTDKIKFRG